MNLYKKGGKSRKSEGLDLERNYYIRRKKHDSLHFNSHSHLQYESEFIFSFPNRVLDLHLFTRCFQKITFFIRNINHVCKLRNKNKIKLSSF